MEIKRRGLALAEVHQELAGFEKRFGVPTFELERAFRTPTGALVETPEFARWSLLRSAANMAEAHREGQGQPVR